MIHDLSANWRWRPILLLKVLLMLNATYKCIRRN